MSHNSNERKCPNCGADLQTRSRYCLSCGQSVPPVNNVQRVQPLSIKPPAKIHPPITSNPRPQPVKSLKNNLKNIGTVVMILGVLSILMSVYIVTSFPWELTEYYDSAQQVAGDPAPSEPSFLGPEFDAMMEVVAKAVVWSGTTFLLLIGGQIISGVALILVGYGLYQFPL